MNNLDYLKRWFRNLVNNFQGEFFVVGVIVGLFFMGLAELKATNIVALIAVAVAGLAFTQNVRHNKLTVLPYIVLTYGREIDETSKFYELSFTFTNVGLGPAIITKFEMYLDGVLTIPANIEEMADLIERALDSFDLTNVYYYQFYKGGAISKDESLNVAKFSVPIAQYNPTDFIAGFDRLRFVLEYESMYKQPGRYIDTDVINKSLEA